jgi:hypothetical protein
MPEYQFYSVKKDGHIAGRPVSYELPNDDVAIEQAKLLLNGRDIEIWEGTRVVSYLVPDKSQ